MTNNDDFEDVKSTWTKNDNAGDYEANEEPQDNCIDVPFATVGMCPCCGAEVHVHELNYGGACFQQICPDCDWSSDIMYDL